LNNENKFKTLRHIVNFLNTISALILVVEESREKAELSETVE